MNREFLTGVIETEEKPIIFSAKNNSFEFCFMTYSTYSIFNTNVPVRIPTQEGFIYGKTHENFNIAIYMGNTSGEILCSQAINIPAFVKSFGNMNETDIIEYDAIQFVGGTLNNVFEIKGLDLEFEEGKNLVKYQNDGICYSVDMPGYHMEVNISSLINVDTGIHGTSINNTDVRLTLKFDKPQSLNTIFDHYDRIRDLLSFMTFRYNVGFEKIYLQKKSQKPDCLSKSAEVFIRNNHNLEIKDCFRNITFEDLGNTLPKLLEILYDNKEKKPKLSLGFIPKDDGEINTIDSTRIRLICSALECELNFVSDINSIENEELEELVKIVKNDVKKFQEAHKDYKDLSNDVYSSISSNINHWSLPLAEKLYSLYQKYEKELNILNKSSVNITLEIIREFVKYRNHITHGIHRALNFDIGITAKYMCGLIYCCVLDRIGMQRQKIQSLCDSTKLLS